MLKKVSRFLLVLSFALGVGGSLYAQILIEEEESCSFADEEYLGGSIEPPPPPPPGKCIDEFGNPILCDREIDLGAAGMAAPGMLQSPINLDQFPGIPLAPNVQAFNYGTVHTWDYSPDHGKARWVIRHRNWRFPPFLSVNGVHYILWQFHCHSGAEHAVRGNPMANYFECHFVHVLRFPATRTETPTVTAVLGVYLEKPPIPAPVALPPAIDFAPGALVPCNPWKYTYWGSLTGAATPPPYQEDIAWMVPAYHFKPIDLGSRNLFLTNAHGVRALQPRNGREVALIP